MTITTSSTTSADGTTIAYDRVGDGMAVILVGGAFQHRAFDPRTGHLADLLGERFTVYHYDRRGRGGSSDTPPYAVAREVEDIAAIIAVAGGAAALFGMSSGAPLALDAVAAGLDVPCVAVYEAPFLVDRSRSVGPDYEQRLDALLADGDRDRATSLFLTEAAGVPAEIVAGMHAAPMWPGFEEVAHTLAYDARIMRGTLDGGPLPADRWAAVRIPVFVADGGASPTTMRTAADALAALLPDTRRVTLANQDHAVEPEVIAPLLAEFYAGTFAARTASTSADQR
ncbi:MAG TPA: alpha/beta hydrolase [Micromonosporaceae bacterium]|jgi:pimeloyl-ACP methyl ester carboxylesterase